jgi:hypothetical protein
MKKYIRFVGANVPAGAAGTTDANYQNFPISADNIFSIEMAGENAETTLGYDQTLVWYKSTDDSSSHTDLQYVTITHAFDVGNTKVGTAASPATTDASGNTGTALVDTGADFQTNGVVAGDTVVLLNGASSVTTTVTSVTDENTLVVGAAIGNTASYVITTASSMGQMTKALQDAWMKVSGYHWRNNVIDFEPPIAVTSIIPNGPWAP